MIIPISKYGERRWHHSSVAEWTKCSGQWPGENADTLYYASETGLCQARAPARENSGSRRHYRKP